MTTRKLNTLRRILGNPYAFIEQLDEPAEAARSFDDVIHQSRIKLQNQYAYLDGDGQFAVHIPSSPAKQTTKSDEEIGRIATALHRRIWNSRKTLWPDMELESPLDMLDPAKVCELLGYGFEEVGSLGKYTERTGNIAVAGMIDRQHRTIKISMEFDPQVRAFTAAHEIGHLLLHADQIRMHRDRGLNGIGVSRDQIEREADKFAAYFLMPGKLLKQEFERRFFEGRFSLTQETAYALWGDGAAQEENAIKSRRHLSRKLASAINFNGCHFHSLASTFNVTVETMAIRLEELQLA
ncbi:ImmA/IrrE family metallo-endopeptidase [Pseudoxanthomonas japonensis]|nr:ImmA/IrrE family metallo-endopeptidase [Pseudoxanthomonas japonensis]